MAYLQVSDMDRFELPPYEMVLHLNITSRIIQLRWIQHTFVWLRVSFKFIWESVNVIGKNRS